jgi:non-ribosomal peptide synthetase component E (peptide arylation enzyme)
MKPARILLIYALVLPPSVCQAEQFWSEKTKITYLYPTSENYVFNVSYSNPLSTCDNGTRYSIALTNPNYNSLVSTLISAFMAGKEILINIDSQAANCQPTINRFIVYP